jgi:hypothetical protein
MSDPYSDYADYSAGATTYYGTPESLTSNAPTVTGTTNYSTDTGTSGTTGSVINSSANPITTNSGPVDASGGNGSIPNSLQNIATQGLNDAVVSAQEFGLGSLTDLLRVGAQGQTTAASAPSAPTAQQSTGLLGQIPGWAWVLAAGAALWLLVRKK